MRDLLEFDDAGAQDAEPAKGVTVGDIRAWFDEMERLRSLVGQRGNRISWLEAEVDRLQAGADMARYWREQYDLLRAHMERVRAAVESHTPQTTPPSKD